MRLRGEQQIPRLAIRVQVPVNHHVHWFSCVVLVLTAIRTSWSLRIREKALRRNRVFQQLQNKWTLPPHPSAPRQEGISERLREMCNGEVSLRPSAEPLSRLD
jgi:hypothetical protein